MKLKTKFLTVAVSAGMIISSISTLAAPSWRFMGYDLNKENYPVIEYEVDESGVSTGRTRLNGYAKKVEWKHSFYEAAYPHVGYNRLYLDGLAQDAYTQAGEALSEQEYRPVFWEAKAPYTLHEVMYSRIPGVMDWKIQPNYVQVSDKKADVKKSWTSYGFSAFKTCYGFVDTKDFLNMMSDSFSDPSVIAKINDSYDYLYSVSGIHENGDFELDTDKLVVLEQEKLTGPKYDSGIAVGTTDVVALDDIVESIRRTYKVVRESVVDENTGEKKEIINEIELPEKRKSTASNFNKDLLTVSDRKAKVEWVYGGYEAAGEHKMYEVASINGELMDGSECMKYAFGEKERFYDKLGNEFVVKGWTTVKGKKPFIARYTGGTANNKEDWVAAWPNGSDPFNKYLRKVVVNNEGNRVLTNEYKPTDYLAKVLPSFFLNSKVLADGSTEYKLTITSNWGEDFDFATLVGNYPYLRVDGTTAIITVPAGETFPEFIDSAVDNMKYFKNL